MELVIEGNAFISGGIKKCCIGIEEGKIKAVKKVLKGQRHHDFGDKLILPAGIDSHVHFRDPGLTHKEDFASGTACAAYGGITCVLDMPNTIPQTTTKEALLEKARLAGIKSHVDFGLFAGVTESSKIEDMARLATAFKIYMASSTGEMQIKSYDMLEDIFERIEGTAKVVSVHCEDESKLDKTQKASSLSSHMRLRPSEAEASAISIVLGSCGNAKVHVCHVSSKEGLELLSDKKATSEVTPHHLLLSCDSNLNSFGKVNPPLRTREDQRALWDALSRGAIDILASDHAPHTLEEKENFSEAPSGMPGVETMFPLMLSLVKHDRFQLKRLANAICERPGEIFQINKGKIEVGYDADLIMVDMREEHEIETKNLHSKCAWTAYEGFTAVFPRFTFLRGEIMVEDWEMTGEAGCGKMIK